MKYCTACQRPVKGVKSKFSWAIFLLGLLTFGILSILYTIYYLVFKKNNKCSVCQLKTISMRKAKRKGYLDPVGDNNDHT